MEIPSVLFLSLEKDTLHEACGNLLIPRSLTRVVLPSFIHQHRVSWESLTDSPGQYLNMAPPPATDGLTGSTTEKLTHWINLLGGRRVGIVETHWRQTLRSLCWSFFFFFGKLMNLVVSTSVARNVCNEIFYSKSKNAITRLAAGSANIIMLQQILDERFTFLHPLVRRLLLPQAGCELYSGRDCCLLKSHN